jgi:hypothetical protein
MQIEVDGKVYCVNVWTFGYMRQFLDECVAKKEQHIVPPDLLVDVDWNLITRMIMPVIYAESPVKGGRDTSGLGDILQSFFFSSKAPVHGWILGAGPALQYPSATENALGSEKWSAGPTAVALRQQNGWTYGALINHLWSYAGTDHRRNVNGTFLQPFLSYTTKTYTTFGVNMESSYDWPRSQWTMPFNWTATQLLKVGQQPVSLQLGARYYADRARGGPDWGLRFQVQLLFPQ